MDKTIQPSLSSYCSNPILFDLISKLIYIIKLSSAHILYFKNFLYNFE